MILSEKDMKAIQNLANMKNNYKISVRTDHFHWNWPRRNLQRFFEWCIKFSKRKRDLQRKRDLKVGTRKHDLKVRTRKVSFQSRMKWAPHQEMNLSPPWTCSKVPWKISEILYMVMIRNFYIWFEYLVKIIHIEF